MIKLGEIYRNNLEYGLVMEVGARAELERDTAFWD